MEHTRSRKRKASTASLAGLEDHEQHSDRRSWSFEELTSSRYYCTSDDLTESAFVVEILSEDEAELDTCSRGRSLSRTESEDSRETLILLDDEHAIVDTPTKQSHSKCASQRLVDVEDSGSTKRKFRPDFKVRPVHDIEHGLPVISDDIRICQSNRRSYNGIRSASVKQQDLIVVDDEDSSSTRDIVIQRASPLGIDQLLSRLNIDEKSRRKSPELDWAHYTAIDSFKGPNFACRPGKNVQFRDGSFMRIESLFVNNKRQTFLKGRRLCQQNHDLFQTNSEIELIRSRRRERNELIWYRIFNSKGTSLIEETFVKPVTCVLRNRDVVFTNCRYPSMSINDDGRAFQSSQVNAEMGPLFCRWKMTLVYDPFDSRPEGSVEHLRYLEADDYSRLKQSGVRCETRAKDQESQSRGQLCPTLAGGSFKQKTPLIDIDGAETSFLQEKYTFGDAFCGAGGASRGALSAGLSVKWSFDKDEEALTSYASNFAKYGAQCLQNDVQHFLETARSRDIGVDILHISPPCQFFSPAHTIPCPGQDEINSAALLSVWQLIEEVKPRVLTIEQTFGLLNVHHKEWFSSILQACITQGYSVRWRILRCQHYGVPQIRRRLFIIAAGPGEKLPQFPQPTHGGMNLKKLVTIGDVLKRVSTTRSEEFSSRRLATTARPAFSMDTLARTVTCGGGEKNYHPSGVRHYALKELAALQTFPAHHSFAGAKTKTSAKKQIGNAVPPILAQAVFREIIKSLHESDKN